VYTQQEATAAGVTTIRQLGLGPSRAASALAAVDAGTAASFAARAVDRWFSMRMELLGNGIVLAAALLGLAAVPGAAAAAGPWRSARSAIAVTQALSVVGLLNWTVRTAAQAETSFTSFQRVAFTVDHTEEEAARHLPSDDSLGPDWPQQGRVTFRGVALRYRPGLPQVLRGVDLEVAPGERVGIVGRTGSGKSTLLRVLLRTFELEEGGGEVLLDGLDVRRVGLARLRSAVTVIPQENFLVTGSVRRNVDPGHEHSDEEVRRALEAASLGHWHLDRHVAAAGGGVSPGERQLLGIARAVMRGSRVVALDEVTSRVDEATDRRVQAALRHFPAGTTRLVVSHRLSTLADYDRVVVMEAGRVVEVGSPRDLQRVPGSHFSRLLAAELAGGDASSTPVSPEPALV